MQPKVSPHAASASIQIMTEQNFSITWANLSQLKPDTLYSKLLVLDAISMTFIL